MAKKTAPKAAEPKYKPTPREHAAEEAFRARQKAMKPAPCMVVKGDGKGGIDIDHPDGALGSLLLMNAIGSTEPDFLVTTW